MQIKARRCFVPISPSRWVNKVFLTCDNKIAVQFNHGQKVRKILEHGPGAYLGIGGVPHVCCLYPGTQGALAEDLYELAAAWSFAGEWVHAFLYKKFGYMLVSPPTGCGDCDTQCSLQSSQNPANVGNQVTFTATITNTDGSPTKGAAPEGSVDWYVDGTWVANSPLPLNEPPTRNWQTATLNWTCGTAGNHIILAIYRPSAEDWSPTQCSLTQTCQGGVQTNCCSNSMPETLYATVVGSGDCACANGTYPMTWTPDDSCWKSVPVDLCGTNDVVFSLFCIDGALEFNFTNSGEGVQIPSSFCDTLQWSGSYGPPLLLLCTGTLAATITA